MCERLMKPLSRALLAFSAHPQRICGCLAIVVCRNTVRQELCEVQADAKDQESCISLLVLVLLWIPNAVLLFMLKLL